MASHTLLEQTIIALEDLPEPVVREVLDFIGFLRQKSVKTASEQTYLEDRRQVLREISGAWEDRRDADEIIEVIYASRTISELDKTL